MSQAQIIDYNYKFADDNHELSHIPGNDGIPYFGRSLHFIFRFYELAKEHYEKYGEISRIKVLHQRGLIVLGADNYQQVFLDKERNFSTETGYESSLGQFYKGGLLLRDFGEHKVQRRIMQSAFKTAAMKGYVTQMLPVMNRHIQQYDQNKKFLFGPHIKRTLLDVGAKIFIGVDGPEQLTHKLNQAFCDINNGLLAQVKKEIPGTAFWRGKRGMRFLHEYFQSIIAARRAGDSQDMFSFMCREQMEDGRFFPDEDILPHISFLLFAAHDTTTSVLNHMVMYSAMQPAWQEKMRAEVDALGKDQLEYEDLDKLQIIDRVFQECLRLHPAAGLLTRRTVRECEMGGYTIPANTMLFIPVVFNHRDPRYWTNPETFDPDRFSPERAEFKNHSFCYHPFGGGAHKCIGMHFGSMLAKVFMFNFLKTYRYSTPQNYKPRLLWVPLPKPARLPLSLERIR